MQKSGKARGLLSLSPLAVFLAVYALTSVVSGDFYSVPVSAAFLLACVYAVIIGNGPLKERIRTFSRGAGNENLLLMIWIFILAGAFAGTAKDIGAVDAAVDATLSILPGRFLFVGLFLASCFISFAMGTSVGTIVALVPLVTGLSAETGVQVGFLAAIIVGGAFFGDNLSFISDTTIAATRSTGCEMKDKFRTNLLIVLPAVAAVIVIYLIQGSSVQYSPASAGVDFLKLLPYLIVIVLALIGMDVTLVLTLGILAAAVYGFADGAFTWTGWLQSAGEGIRGMADLIVVTLLAGGLLELIRAGGGLDFLVNGIVSRVRGPRGAQASIAALVSVANLCTANNTIAIITCGGIARDISERFGIPARKAASILDTFSCLVQALIPYGAQLLMATSLAGVAATDIIPNLYYPFIMGSCAIAAIVFKTGNSRG